MNDTLAVKAILPATIDAAELDGANTRTFPRVASSGSEHVRRSLHVGSLSPCDLIISHVPRTAKNNVQRSLAKFEQTLTRLDVSSNPISSTVMSFGFQTNIPQDVTLAEWRALVMLAAGLLLESNGAIADALYNGEY